jgi:hypothetical protein
MSEVRIYKIGPLDDESTSLYVPMSMDRVLEVVDARNDVDGVTQIVEQWPEATYLCSPDLAEAASRLNLGVAPLEAVTEGTRIWTAMQIAQSPDFDDVRDPWSVLILMRGARDFLTSGVIQRWPSRLSIEVELRGSREARWFGALLTSPHPGLVLFRDASTAKKCALLDGDEQHQFILMQDHLQVQFEPAPEYVTKWIRDFYKIESMPHLIKREGETVLANDEDALVMGGALSALSLVDDVRETMYTVTKTPEREVRTFVSPGEPWPFVLVPGMP